MRCKRKKNADRMRVGSLLAGLLIAALGIGSAAAQTLDTAQSVAGTSHGSAAASTPDTVQPYAGKALGPAAPQMLDTAQSVAAKTPGPAAAQTLDTAQSIAGTSHGGAAAATPDTTQSTSVKFHGQAAASTPDTSPLAAGKHHRRVAVQTLDTAQPYTGEFHAIGDPAIAGSPLDGTHLRMAPTSKLFHDTTIIDFEKRQVTVARFDTLGYIIWTHHYGELDEYINDRAMAAIADDWAQGGMLADTANGATKQHDLKLAWEMPVVYPGWAQRVLGTDPPRLSITGSLRITMAYENIQLKDNSLFQQSTGPGFKFDEQNQFTVSGSVGRLININITQNSQGDVDANNPLKNFKIDYKETKPGELEDEIVQQVTAGYTSFDMPGTQLSGFSESEDGLFGVKLGSKFGPLSLTGIASNQQGESGKISVNNNSGSGTGVTPIPDNGFTRNKYYFLDTAFIRYYNQEYSLKNGTGISVVPSDLQIDTLEVWQSLTDMTLQNTIKTTDPLRPIHNFYCDSASGQKVQFVKLYQNRHFYANFQEGWIRIDSVTVQDNDILGVYMSTKGHTAGHAVGLKKGGVRGDSTYPSFLWTLKPITSGNLDSLGADRSRFPLMWRNVYPMPGTVGDISSFKLSIFMNNLDGGTDSGKTVGNNVLISDTMGLTTNGAANISKSAIYSWGTRELIIPPFDTSSIGNQPFNNPVFGTNRDSMVYHYAQEATTLQAMLEYKPPYTIEMSGSSKQTVFSLGIGVMASSIQVMADGRQLQANTDYAFNEDAGTLELTSPAAKAATKVDINFQRESMFTAAQKLFMGARAEMALPFLSDKSLIGFSMLYQSTSIAQDIPHLGQEPFSKLFFDLNAHFDFQPAWMTSLVNKLPLISTAAPSTATVDFEIAHSSMNPNTAGQSYIDDFESSQQVFSLGEGYKSWYRASPPVPSDSFNQLIQYPPAWDWYWFTPVYTDNLNGVLKDSVWIPESSQVYTGTDKYESVLRLHVMPSPADANLQTRYRHPWAGIMYPVPQSMANRENDLYFDILLKSPKGGAGNGKLRVQLGRMNEDLCLDGAPPNGVLDKEDTSIIWRENHDPNLDWGLDRLWDKDETWLVPNAAGDGWDTLKYGDSRLAEWASDPAKDNYRLYDVNNVGNYKYACRYQGDGWATASEDIYNDGAFISGSVEQYHEYTINLADTNCRYIDTTAKLVKGSGWHRYRLPLHELLTGSPSPDTLRRELGGMGVDDWSNIRMVRLIWDGWDTTSLTTEKQLIMEGMEFEGNQWMAMRDSTGNSNMDVSTVGTTTSAEYEASLATTNLIHRQLDQNNLLAPEQSLQLNFHGLIPNGQATAQRSFSVQPLNIASYDSMTLVVYGYPYTGSSTNPTVPLYNGHVQFVFRFGSDSSTYYEYRCKILPKWNNYCCVNLKRLSDLKLSWFTNHLPDSAIDTVDATGALRIVAPSGNRQPNFANISWMAVGVVRDSTDTGSANALGEIWVDELKGYGIKQFNGWSSRLNFATQWADFLNLSGGFTYQGGNFKTMSDNGTSLGNSTLSANVNASTGLDKFMPKGWGVSLPVGANLTTTLTRPQIKPNTDIYLTNSANQPDGFVEMAADMVNRIAGHEIINTPVTASEHYDSYSSSQSLFFDYSKSNTSTNPIVDMLLQRLKTHLAYSSSVTQTRYGKVSNDADTDYIDLDSVKSYSGSLSYDLSPRTPPAWTKWKPFGGSKAPWLPSHIKDIEFNLLPSVATVNLANATFKSEMTQQDEPGVAFSQNDTKDLNLTQGVTLDYSPIHPLVDFNYQLNINRDFPQDSIWAKHYSAMSFITDEILKRHSDGTWHGYDIFQNETGRTQAFKVNLNPQIFDWLTTTAGYNANFTGQLTNLGTDSAQANKQYMNAQVNSGVNASSGLTFGTLLQGLSSPKGPGKVAGLLKSGFDFIGFNTVNFNFASTSNLTNQNLGAEFLSSQNVGFSNFMAYQLGLANRSLSDIVIGDMNDRTALGGMRYRMDNGDSLSYYTNDSRAVTQTAGISTSLGLTKPFDLQLSNISLKWSRQFSLRPDTTFFDTTWTYPDFSIGARSTVLDKIGLINKLIKGASLTSAFTVKETSENSSANSEGKIFTTIYDMSPLASVEGTLLKLPITFKYQHTLHRELSSDTHLITRDGDNLDLTYDIQKTTGLSTIKLLFWSIPVRGKTSLGMTLMQSHQTEMTLGVVATDISNLSVQPHLSYIFTDNVTGTLQYTGSRVDNLGQITTTNTVSMIADIKF